MDTVVNDFMQTLRDQRLRVSPAGGIDTPNALQNTGSGERETVKDSLNFSASEQRETEAAVQRIVRRIRGTKTRRLKEDRIGRISAPHTLRHNVRYEGVPFDPVLRRKDGDKPRVPLLCNIVLSTRNLVRFWLHMIYQMRSPVGAAIISGDGALVTVRAREPYSGKIDLPGGFPEVGEHPVDGLKREVREELGLEIEVDPTPLLLAPHTYGPEGVWALAIGFRAHTSRGVPEPADDVAGARWIGAGEVDGVDFAWEHDRGFVRAALEQRG